MLSWPHFFQADPKLLDAVDGLKPDQEKHQSYFDVQPVCKNNIPYYGLDHVLLITIETLSI